MKITKEEYEAALKRIDELLPLVTDDTPEDDCNLIELLKVSGIVDEYEKNIIQFLIGTNQTIYSVKDSEVLVYMPEFY